MLCAPRRQRSAACLLPQGAAPTSSSGRKVGRATRDGTDSRACHPVPWRALVQWDRSGKDARIGWARSPARVLASLLPCGQPSSARWDGFCESDTPGTSRGQSPRRWSCSPIKLLFPVQFWIWTEGWCEPSRCHTGAHGAQGLQHREGSSGPSWGLGGSLANNPDLRKEISQEVAVIWGCWAGRTLAWAPPAAFPILCSRQGQLSPGS